MEIINDTNLNTESRQNTDLDTNSRQVMQILSVWNSLDNNTQKKTINFIIPFVQNASLLSFIQAGYGDTNIYNKLDEQLGVFKEKYFSIYKKDVSQLGVSDLSKESNQVLKKNRWNK